MFTISSLHTHSVVCLDSDGLKAVFACVLITKLELFTTVCSSKCCWCTLTCRFASLWASCTQWGTQRRPQSQASEAARVWAGNCNHRSRRKWWSRLESLLVTQMPSSDCGFDRSPKSGCLFSERPGKTPWTSTLLEAQAASCVGLPSRYLRQGTDGGSEEKRPHPLGPGGVWRLPPREKGVYDPSPTRMSASAEELLRTELEDLKKKQ